MTTSFRVLILGYGEMGHAMEYLLKDRQTIAIWEKFPQPGFQSATLADSAPKADIAIFCLPVNPHREVIRLISPLLSNDCLCVSIAKGIDETGKIAAQIFTEDLPPHQPHALLYGPMIAEEIRAGHYAFAQVGCSNAVVFQKLRQCFRHTGLCIDQTDDIIGISWSVILKNVYAMAFGMADELKLGDNVRGFLAVAALRELNQIVLAMGGQSGSSYHLAGLGDLITTATSESSHHHELGRKLARGETSGITGEGPHTLKMINQHQLFNTQHYPLLQLIDAVIRQPQDALGQIRTYLEHLYP